ncbi:Hypothetical protein D9617_27g045220 [Elsinoe fawcettii]|nr:Hypothetical protein D9617_27g045220 [Elsinoe fawcettii]
MSDSPRCRIAKPMDRKALNQTIDPKHRRGHDKFHRFLDLQAEIRQMIYRERQVCLDSYIESVRGSNPDIHQVWGGTGNPILLSLSLVCVHFYFFPSLYRIEPGGGKRWSNVGIQLARTQHSWRERSYHAGASAVFVDIMIEMSWGRYLDSLEVYYLCDGETEATYDDALSEHKRSKTAWPNIMFAGRANVTWRHCNEDVFSEEQYDAGEESPGGMYLLENQ